ncbi:MAG TPA: CdaR family protein [Kofleriaceae bacterium]|nr:CdaR family protein [Kofleriaceae bacterium]
MRPRAQTIGTLGRAPARVPRPPQAGRTAPAPDPPPERGALRRWLRGAMFDNVGLKFLSMVLAITVFLLVNTDKDREITVRVGVSYTLPENKVLVSDRVDDVGVTIKGSWRRLRRFDPREVDRINLDLRRAATGEIAITNDMIHLPSGLAITSISPHYVRVAFDKRVDKVVEVSAAVIGHPLHGYILEEVKSLPATIKLRGANGTLAALTAIRTNEVSVEGRSDSFVAETEVLPPDGVEVVGNPRISVQIRIDEELVTKKLPGLPVVVRGDGEPSRWTVAPAQVEVSLTGALLAVEKARESLVPVVKVPPDGRPREVEVTIEGLPPGIGVKISPEHAKLAPAKPAAPRAP